MPFISIIMLLMLGAIWGASFPFIKLSLESFDPATIVAFRLAGASVVLYLVMRWQRHRLPRGWRVWRDMLVVGNVGMVLPFLLITWGELHISSSLAAIIVATTPLFTLLLAFVWLRSESLGWLRSIGVLLGFSGVLVAIGINDANLADAGTWGELAVIGAALCYAITALYARRAFKDMAPLVVATGTMLAGTLTIVPLAFFMDGLPTMQPTANALLGLVGLTLLSTAMAYILYYWILDKLGAPRATMVTYLIPSFALIYGWLWLQETIGWDTFVGLLLVFAGIIIANGVPRLRRRPTVAADTP